jgi:hypothetical protein
MATRSRIAIKTGSVYRSVYCHNDGYPEWNGLMLLFFHSTEKAAKKLMEMGDMSSLKQQIGRKHSFAKHSEPVWSLFYKRDRGDPDAHAMHDNDLLQLIQRAAGCDAEYLYLWFDDKWHFCPVIDEPGDIPHLEVLTVWHVFGIERSAACPLKDDVHPLVLADWLEEYDNRAEDAALIRTRWMKYETK